MRANHDGAAADALSYPPLPIPEPGRGVEITPELHWLRLPLPSRLNHINVWLLGDAAGWTLVDTGIRSDELAAIWEDLAAAYFAERPLRRVLVTHHHPDHFGLAGTLSRRHGVPVFMSALAARRARQLTCGEDMPTDDEVAAFYGRHGLADTARMVAVAGGRSYGRVVDAPPSELHVLAADEVIDIGARRWRCLEMHGHADGHIALYCESLGVLIAGDQVLPQITPNISVFALDPEANPLAAYLASLERLAALPASTLVLPSHGRVFHGLRLRIEALRAHHETLCRKALACCVGGATVADVLPALFPRELDDLNFMLAFGETLAHLRYMSSVGRLHADAGDPVRFHAEAK
ncbi:MAG: MBL fold metallo-hydrolase [Gammaproteobacteria bacterium]|nr:MBL fold metallo-hydrolase [Gammaproteobacteria bacterium]